MIGSRQTPVIDPEDRIHIPRIAFGVAALLFLAFTAGAFDALLSNHFRSWNRLTLSPEGSGPRLVEDLLPAARVVTMVGGAAFGYTTLRRVVAEGYRRGAIRLGAVTFSPILVEMLDFGTQDGSVPDLEKLPVHSTVGLVIVTVLPAVLAANDWRQLRTRLR